MELYNYLCIALNFMIANLLCRLQIAASGPEKGLYRWPLFGSMYSFSQSTNYSKVEVEGPL